MAAVKFQVKCPNLIFQLVHSPYNKITTTNKTKTEHMLFSDIVILLYGEEESRNIEDSAMKLEIRNSCSTYSMCILFRTITDLDNIDV